jgi:type IV secretion system protein TrbL
MVAAGGVAGAALRGGAAALSGAAGAARGGASLAGSASAAYTLGSAGQSGASGIASGIGGIARAGAAAASSPLKRAISRAGASMQSSADAGARAAFETTGGTSTLGTVGGAAEAANDASFDKPAKGQPAWAKRMQRSQRVTHGVQTAAHAVRSGDSHGGGSSIKLAEGN